MKPSVHLLLLGGAPGPYTAGVGQLPTCTEMGTLCKALAAFSVVPTFDLVDPDHQEPLSQFEGFDVRVSKKFAAAVVPALLQQAIGPVLVVSAVGHTPVSPLADWAELMGISVEKLHRLHQMNQVRLIPLGCAGLPMEGIFEQLVRLGYDPASNAWTPSKVLDLQTVAMLAGSNMTAVWRVEKRGEPCPPWADLHLMAKELGCGDRPRDSAHFAEIYEERLRSLGVRVSSVSWEETAASLDAAAVEAGKSLSELYPMFRG